jgi:hypothetical protein
VLPTYFWIAISFLHFNFINHNVSSLPSNVGWMVRALRFVIERFPVLIQTVPFCVSALILFISSEAKRVAMVACLLEAKSSRSIVYNMERSSRSLDERSFAPLAPFHWTSESTQTQLRLTVTGPF